MRTVSTEVFVQSIKAGRVNSVLPMIAEKARATHFKLPYWERHNYPEQVLVQEGIAHTVMHVAKKFDMARAKKTASSGTYIQGKKKNTVKFSTYLFYALDNFYADIIRSAYRDKRLASHGVVSLDSTKVSVSGGREISLIDKIKLTRRTSKIEMTYINRIDAERAIMRGYEKASPLLRRYLIKWLIQPKAGRFKVGREFNAAKKEFRRVIRPLLNSELADTIQKDYMCRNNIVRKMLTYSTQKKKSQSGFLNSEEAALLPIVPIDLAHKLIPVIGMSTCEVNNLAVIG